MTLRVEVDDLPLDLTPQEQQLMEDAEKWVERLKVNDPTTRIEFRKWARGSRNRRDEFLIMAALDRVVDDLSAEQVYELDAMFRDPPEAAGTVPNFTASLGESWRPVQLQRPAKPRFGAKPAVAIAAGLALAAAAGIWIHSLFRDNSNQLEYSTVMGVDRTITLSDGSTLSMSGGSHLTVFFSASERRIGMDNGDVLFRVVPDVQRPFRVMVAGGAVQAVSTQFNVRQHSMSDFSFVDVVQGRVRIDPQHATYKPRELGVGEQARLYANGRIELVSSAPQTITPIPFRETSLAEIFKRLDEPPGAAVVLSPGAQDYRFSGTLNKNDAPLLLSILRHRKELRVTDTDDVIRVELQNEAAASQYPRR